MKTTVNLQRRRLLTSSFSFARPALFIDRDGVLIEDKHYLSDAELVQLCVGSKEILLSAQSLGYPIVVITNQSGIARGYFDWNAYERVTDRLLTLLGAEVAISAIYANGYSPTSPDKTWRKPSPGMLLAATEDLNLDLKHSVLIGDRLCDLEAGANAGLATVVHVLTGHGKKERPAVLNASSNGRFVNHSNPHPKLILADSLLE